PDLNPKFLQDKYKSIKGFYRLSCKSNKGVAAFKKALQAEITRVEMIKTTWPEKWFEVKNHLETMAEHYISYDDYKGICMEAGVTKTSGQRTLVEFLNDLGVTLYFKDIELKEMQVLNPRWITGAVYRIINAEILAEQNGILELGELEDILVPTEDGFEYPGKCHSYIINLMEKFE
ncbi:MAG: hypothetical protein GY940_43230, partial [bacterium]|nr:hypothetical protein [bacterium]